MNIFEFKNSKTGMTLVEMVISIVILGILMTSTMGMVISSNNIFISTSKAAIDRQVGNKVFTFIEKSMRYTTHLSIYDSESAAGDSGGQYLALNVTDTANQAGTLKYKTADGAVINNLYPDSFYGGRTVQYSVKSVGTSQKHVEINVKVFREGKVVYNHSTKVKCVNLALVTMGQGKNMIFDKSSKDSVNQFLSFSVDEQLIAGGENAFSTEFKVNDFMGRYNKLLAQYTALLNEVYGDYDSDFNDPATTLGVGGTIKSTVAGDSIPVSLFCERNNKLLKIVYGENVAGKENEFSPEEGSINEGTSVFDCVNLRAYYQNEIKNLLGFTPTGASTSANWKAGSYSTSTYTGSNGNVSCYKHDGDPYYGIVATKEELYLGYMLEYNDNNNDKKITKDEYPSFTDADTFFAGTSIKSYLNSTSTKNDKNQMTIMTYFKDNINDQYAKLVSRNEQTKVEACSGETGAGFSSEAWVTGGTVPSLSGIADTSTPMTNGNKAYRSIDVGRYNNRNGSSAYGNQNYDTYQVYYTKADASADNFNLSMYTRYNNGYNYAFNTAQSGKVTGADAVADLKANATELKYETFTKGNRSSSKFTIKESVDNYVYLNGNAIYIVPYRDLTAGWYYVTLDNVTHFFYLGANNDTGFNAKNIAVHAATRPKNNQYSNYNDTEFKKDVKIAIQLKGSSQTEKYVDGYAYAQASYAMMATGDSYTIDTNFKTYVAHQFDDYVLYGVDWNSWFKARPTGLVNQIISGVMNIVNRIFGQQVQGDVTSISASNAVQALGNRGKYSSKTFDNDIASYNMAFCIYNAKRGTWYYLPTTSTRLSSALSSLSFTSNKDQPTVIDVELNSGNTWRNSTAMINDIDQRRMSSSGLFGLIDTTSDVLWVPLPTGNEVDVDLSARMKLNSLSIDSVTFDPAFDRDSTNQSAVLNKGKNGFPKTSEISYGAEDSQATVSVSVTGTGASYKESTSYSYPYNKIRTITWATSGNTAVNITVQNKDKSVSTTYTIIVEKAE